MKKNKMMVLLILILSLSFTFISCGKEKVSEETKNETAIQIAQEDAKKEEIIKEEANKKIENEEDFQQEEVLDTKFSDTEYTYENIINSPGGIVKSPSLIDIPNVVENKKYARKVTEELKKLEPISEDATDEEIEELFRKILVIGALDYTPLDTIDRFPYVIFKADKEDPWTKRKVEEDMKINVEIVLDASGSMRKKIDGVSMMDIAKNSIEQVLSKMPENANVGLRVFGHLGDNTSINRELSCGANKLIYPIKPLDMEGIKNALEPIQATGWTSIAKSIENGVNDFQDLNENSQISLQRDYVTPQAAARRVG